MAGREASFFEKVLYRRFEFQKADGICDGGTVFAASLCYLFLR